jgi:hypothetical protein
MRRWSKHFWEVLTSPDGIKSHFDDLRSSPLSDLGRNTWIDTPSKAAIITESYNPTLTQPGNTSLFFPAKTKVNCDWGNNTCEIVVSNCVGCVTGVFFFWFRVNK